MKRVKHFLVRPLLEFSAPDAGPDRAVPAILHIRGFHFRVMYYTLRKRVLRTDSNQQIHGGPPLETADLIVKPSSDMEPVCTRLKTDWNRLQSVYTIHIIYI